MIPVPRSRHSVALAALGAVSILTAVLALRDPRFSADQVHAAVNAVRGLEPTLYRHDPVFGHSGLWQFHTPLWTWYLERVHAATGDPMLGMRLLAGPLALAYLLGVYALLWQQCRSWSVALFTAVLSLVVIYAPGGSFWGLGPLLTMRADAVCIALTPLVTLWLLRWLPRASVLWVFLAAGLLANVHPITGMNLTLILLATYLGHHRFRPRALGIAVLGALCALGAASPYLLHFGAARFAVDRLSATAGAWPAVARAFEAGRLPVLYPAMFYDTLAFVAYTLALWIPALIVMIRAERFRVRNLRFWVWMILACLGVGLILHGASQIAGLLTGSPPPVIDFVHALRFVMLPLYVLFAQAVVHLLRLPLPRLKLWVRLGLAILMFSWVTPSYNLRGPRYAIEDAVEYMLPEALLTEKVEDRERRRAALDELEAIGDYLREDTPPDTVVAADVTGDDLILRLWSRRALVASPSDLRAVYYLAPGRIGPWLELVERQSDVLSPRHGRPVDTDEAFAFARRHGAAYLVIHGNLVPDDADPWRVTVPGRPWGRHWQLLRVPRAD